MAAKPAALHLLPVLLAVSVISCQPRLSPQPDASDSAWIVSQLASNSAGGRLSGDISGRRAAQWIADFYRQHGFFPAFGGSFMQSFPFDAGLIPSTESMLQWQSSSGTVQIPAQPFPLSAPGKQSGKAVFLGFCLKDETQQRDDFAGRDLQGAIIFCLRYAPGGRGNSQFVRSMSFNEKYRAARAAGAAAVVFLNLPAGPPVEPGAFAPRISSGPPAVFVESELLEQSLPWLTSASADDRVLEQRLGQRLGPATVRSEYALRRQQGRNVGAWLRPPREGQRNIMIAAHFDHLGYGNFAALDQSNAVHPGADDNASGVAAVMEAAGELQWRDNQHSDSAVAAESNVLFIHFDAEERGLLGATAFAASHEFRSASFAAMLNLDMVGRLRKGKGLMLQGAQSADPSWRAAIEHSFQNAGFPGALELRLLPGGSGPSDHSVFYARHIPVAMFFTGGHREYHTAADRPDTLNYDGIARIAQMAANLGSAASRLNPAPVFQRAPAEPARSGFEFKLRLGIMPANYDRRGDGVEVGDVHPEAPVARTGLRAGDHIVQLGDVEVRTIDDYMRFLEDARGGRSYRIVFVRDGRRISGETALIAGED
ncbi:MAG: M28 family peptidase [Leptospirales bacterium]|nr:M28 family peptidase [Leptospirales bacterium]